MCSLLFLALVHRHMFADHYPKPCPVLSACGSARPPTTGRNGPWASVRSSDSATWETDFGHNKMGLLCVKWCKYVIICVNRYPHKIPQVTIPLNGEFQADFGDLDGYTTYFGMSGWTDSQTWMFHTYQTCEVKSQTCGSKMINAVTYEGVSWSSQKFWWGYSFSYFLYFGGFCWSELHYPGSWRAILKLLGSHGQNAVLLGHVQSEALLRMVIMLEQSPS